MQLQILIAYLIIIDHLSWSKQSITCKFLDAYFDKTFLIKEIYHRVIRIHCWLFRLIFIWSVIIKTKYNVLIEYIIASSTHPSCAITFSCLVYGQTMCTFYNKQGRIFVSLSSKQYKCCMCFTLISYQMRYVCLCFL